MPSGSPVPALPGAPLEAWRGAFGDAYTLRNAVDWRSRLPAFRRMLERLEIRSALEVGCNRGHNLRALAELLGPDCRLAGVDPNRHAVALALSAMRTAAAARAPGAVRTTLPGSLRLLRGQAERLPFRSGSFDLVFTAGVLIHIGPDALGSALAEVHRVSRRWILALEYFAESDTPVRYRGHEGLLWKRDFARHFQDCFTDLALTRSGFWGPADGFDRVHWWLLAKPARGAEGEDTAEGGTPRADEAERGTPRADGERRARTLRTAGGPA